MVLIDYINNTLKWLMDNMINNNMIDTKKGYYTIFDL